MILKVHVSLLLALLYNLFFAKKSIYFIAYLFIIMHELSHMIVALLLKVDIDEITLLPFGTTAKYVGNISLLKEFLISIAGPIASLLFAFVYGNRTYFIVNFIIFFFNMIPIYPLDGGRIVRILIISFFGKSRGMKINQVLNKIMISILLIFSVFLLCKYHHFYFLILSFVLIRIYQKERIIKQINYLQISK